MRSADARGASSRALLVAALALASCGDTHAPSDGSGQAPSGASAREHSTVGCRTVKDENLCSVAGSITPFVLGQLAKNHALRTATLHLEKDAATTENLAQLVKLADDISAFDLEPGKGSVPDLAALPQLPNLRSLRIWYGSERASGVKRDVSSIARFTSLRRLRLHGADLPDLAVLTPLSDLEELSITDASLRDLGGLAGHARLRDLQLASVGDQAASTLRAVATLTALETLHVRLDARVCDLSWLPELPDLASFSVSAFRCADAVDATLFARAPKLAKLRLQGLNIVSFKPLATAPLLRDLFVESLDSLPELEALAGAPKLERLYLSQSKLEDVSIVASFTQLKRLEIYSQRLLTNTDALEKLTQLEELGLYVYAKGSVEDLPLLAKLPALKRVSLRGDFVSHQVKSELAKRYPNLTFVDDLPRAD